MHAAAGRPLQDNAPLQTPPCNWCVVASTNSDLHVQEAEAKSEPASEVETGKETEAADLMPCVWVVGSRSAAACGDVAQAVGEGGSSSENEAAGRRGTAVMQGGCFPQRRRRMSGGGARGSNGGRRADVALAAVACARREARGASAGRSVAEGATQRE